MSAPEIDKLRSDAQVVFRYWRTVEHWLPNDINEARNALVYSVENGGQHLADAIAYYSAKASSVRSLLVDQTPIAGAVPPPFRPRPRSSAGKEQQESLLI